MNNNQDGTALAPDDQVWVCGACGKKSRNRYGFVGSDPGPYTSVADPGWDESCMLNAVLCHAQPLPDQASGTLCYEPIQ